MRKLRIYKMNDHKKLESKVTKINKNLIQEDYLGSYIPFCSFHRHIGIIEDETKCKKVYCRHYNKFYFKH